MDAAAELIPDLRKTLCPICETDRHDREVYVSNFESKDLNEQVFSARRLPDRLHYRMVRCRECGLLRSNPILSPVALARLYEKSRYTYAAEAIFTRRTYGELLRRAAPLAPGRERIMEIGCGSGFFLEDALAQGFREAHGVEPSTEAIAHAPEHLRPTIRQGLYDETTFPAEHFDAVCAFQVFDHVPDQTALLRACRKHLKKGGVALFVNHDARATTARILGRLSPIIDVEHTALFDKTTFPRIFRKCGFEVRDVFAVKNTYPLSYWTQLAPLPGLLKSPLLALLRGSSAGRIPITLSAGNIGILAAKS